MSKTGRAAGFAPSDTPELLIVIPIRKGDGSNARPQAEIGAAIDRDFGKREALQRVAKVADPAAEHAVLHRRLAPRAAAEEQALSDHPGRRPPEAASSARRPGSWA